MERLLLDILGLACIAFGVVLLPTPLPFGIILIALGTLLLAISEEGVRKLIKDERHKHPRFDRALRKAKDYLPKPLADVLKRTET